MTEPDNIIAGNHQPENLNPEGEVPVTEDNENAGRVRKSAARAGNAAKSRKAEPESEFEEPEYQSIKKSPSIMKLMQGISEIKEPELLPQPEPEPEYEEPEYQSIKTPSVMKLMEEVSVADNQVIAAGKSRIPKQLRGIEPLSRIVRRQSELAQESQPVVKLVSCDLTLMAAEETAPEILRRFNACQCSHCIAEISRLAAAELPSRYIELPENSGLDYDGVSDEERQLAASIKKSVVSIMIKLMIGNKKRNFH